MIEHFTVLDWYYVYRNSELSIRKPSLMASLPDRCILFWERGISLPAAQLDVIAMEKILRRGVGNLTSRKKVGGDFEQRFVILHACVLSSS